MSRLSFKDRFLTPPVARAMTSPVSILLAGAGASVAIATGLPLVAAPVIAVAAWGARVLASVPKAAPVERIDPFSLPEPWRSSVVEALKAQVRYDRAVAAADPGPIRSRLETIGERIDDGVQEAWRIARRGAQLVEARAGIDADEARRDLARVEADANATWAAGSNIERTAQALRSQIETAERLDTVLEQVRSQLQLLDARLDESVARAIELSVQVGDVDDLTAIDADVDGLVNEMEALRLALEETSRPAVPPTRRPDSGTEATGS